MKIKKPVRVRRTYTQRIIGSPDDVFRLLCPVREVEWVAGWEPRLVITESGFIEPGCVFVMPDNPADSVWVVTRWEPATYQVHFVKITPGLAVGRIEIALRATRAGETSADVSYEYTALSEAGSEFVARFTEEYYQKFMKEWEMELNAKLSGGRETRRTGP